MLNFAPKKGKRAYIDSAMKNGLLYLSMASPASKPALATKLYFLKKKNSPALAVFETIRLLGFSHISDFAGRCYRTYWSQCCRLSSATSSGLQRSIPSLSKQDRSRFSIRLTAMDVSSSFHGWGSWWHSYPGMPFRHWYVVPPHLSPKVLEISDLDL